MSLKDFGDLMKQAQQAQGKIQEIQEQVASLEVEGESGAGLARVLMNGRHEVKNVTLDSGLLDEELEVVEDLIAAACNDAVQKVEKAQADKMKELAGGMGFLWGDLSFNGTDRRARKSVSSIAGSRAEDFSTDGASLVAKKQKWGSESGGSFS